jgi:hypothetical protein
VIRHPHDQLRGVGHGQAHLLAPYSHHESNIPKQAGSHRCRHSAPPISGDLSDYV